jgi:hypothetical protein
LLAATNFSSYKVGDEDLDLAPYPSFREALFVHHSGIAGHGFKSLDEGAKVASQETRGQKGMQASNVTPV